MAPDLALETGEVSRLEGPSRRLAAVLGSSLGVVCFLGALFLLRRELTAYHYRDLVQAFRALPRIRTTWALLLTAASYLLLTLHDTLALRYLRKPLPYRRTAFASLVGYAVSNSAGHSLITGGSLRYRLYSAWGLSAFEVSGVVGFCDLAIWLGYGTVAGLVFLLEPLQLPELLRLPFASPRPLGLLLLLLVAGFLAFTGLRRRPLAIRGWQIRLPSLQITTAAAAVSCLDWLVAASTLFVLLPTASRLDLPAFLGVFLLAQTVGMLSQVPAGLGVFETMVIVLLRPTGLPSAAVLTSLLLFRVIYYVIPLCVAAAMLGVNEVLRHWRPLRRAASSVGQWVTPIVPHLFAFTTFLAGSVLLFSSATPAEMHRLGWLQDIVPLPLIELSHFLGSLVGVALLLLARGLQRRLDGAYVLTCVLLAAGAVFSLIKGVDYEEATLLIIMLAALLPCRDHFYRRASLTSPRFSPGWVIAIGLVLVSAVWLGIFSYKHLELSGELWWRFALRANAPRSLRATVGALVVALVFALSRLLRPAPVEHLAKRPDIERVAAIVARSPDTMAHLALLGDKEILESTSGEAFLMFGVASPSWIALGDPIGPPEEHQELVWRFREMVDRHGGRTVFYQVSRQALPLYLDLGLTLQKIGEEARVCLADWNLEGQDRKKLRNAVHRMEREGCAFELLPPAAVPALLPRLQQVSAAWLAGRRTREKGFSLGFFDEDYLRRCPLAIVRRGDEILAFTNLWLGAGHEEMSFDLMRQLPEAPPGLMDFLVVSLLGWGRNEGYRWCNLGMAPLSGLDSRSLAPLWSRLGALAFRHGESLYNFQGVRQFKAKFDPLWEPRYLASPGGVALPRILAHLSSLIARGMKGILTK